MSKKFLLGKKIGMTSLITEDGEVIPVTVIEAGPCKVVKIQTPERDGYSSVLLGFVSIDEKKVSKPLQGFFKKQKVGAYRILSEFRTDEQHGVEVGQDISATTFEPQTKVNVRGRTIGRGFAGTIKRWNFRRGPMTHGSKSHRITGSIGAGTTPGRVLKGKKMAGRYGNDNVTIRNLAVVKVDASKNLLFVKGAVPGKRNGILEIEAA
ncbi:MAG: 50S ribosomal protein L3 [bacterium]|nr:50S ribosomal protein L3 [bacterium]